MSMTALEQFVDRLSRNPPAGSRVHAHLTLPPTVPAFGPEPAARLPSWLMALLHTQGIERLSASQWRLLEAVQQGQHVCLAAPAGGGRGIARLLVLYRSLGEPGQGHALCIVSQKHRELAQLRTVLSWNEHLPAAHRLSAAIYDGDTPRTQRRTIKQSPPALLLTTPEMLHAGILAYHGGWRAFFERLRYVVLADLHHCQGALGVHLAHLWRRVLRVCRHYGARPQHLVTSAPYGNLAAVVQALTGEPGTVIVGEAWRRQPQSRIMVKTSGDPEAVQHDLVARLETAGLTPLVLSSASPHPDPASVSNAGSMLCVGMPVPLTQVHEYLARLASRPLPSIGIVMLSGQTPLERYLLRYPAVYQTGWQQDMPLEAGNPLVTRQHLLCAAAELALEAGERYAGLQGVGDIIRQLAAERAIERRPESRQWVAVPRQPHRRVRLRSYEPALAVIQQHDRRFLSALTPQEAFRQAFEGAILPLDGQLFHVERCLTERRRIEARPSVAHYRTRAVIRAAAAEPRIESAVTTATYGVTYGTLRYDTVLQAYERLDAATYERLSVHALTGKQRQFRSHGVWFELPETTALPDQDPDTAVHTLIHAVLAVLPLVVVQEGVTMTGGLYGWTTDGSSRAPAVFVDVQDGGNGLSTCLYRAHERVLRVALQLLLQCTCEHGCHRCITGLRCDACARETAIDLRAGIGLLQRMLQETVPSLARVNPPADTATAVAAVRARKARHVYLRLSTRKSAEEVGGWQHKHLLGLAVAVLYDTSDDQYRVYTAETVDALVERLRTADLVIGFNLRDFDYSVLQPYTSVPLANLPTLAILDEVQQALGFRLSLGHLAQQTLGVERPDDSLQTIRWFREGTRNRVIDSCRRDVELLRALVVHGSRTGTLQYLDHTGQRQVFAVNWQMATRDG
jgi:DEAD/DEAH box helicase domain-containing protein